MQKSNSARRGSKQISRSRRAALIAVSTLSLANVVKATTLYFDANGTAAGWGSGANQWDENTTLDWDTAKNTATSTGTNAPGTWLQPGQTQGTNDFNTGEFEAAFTANVSGTVDLGGITYDAGATTIGGTGAAGSYLFNIGNNNVAFTLASGVTALENIFVPIKGSGNITWSMVSGGTMDMSGDMSQFTGNIYVNNGGNRATGGTTASLNFAYASGNPSATVYIDSNIAFGTDNYRTNNGITTPTMTTVNNSVVLNYGGSSGTPVTTANNFLYASNGTDSLDFTASTGLYTTDSDNPVMGVNGVPITETVTTGPDAGQTVQQTMAGQEKFINFTGAISSPTSEVVSGVTTPVTTNVYIGTQTGTGGRGDVILSNHETWTGKTTITETSTNGLVSLGIDNAFPTTTNLTFGTGANAVASLDLAGYSMQVGALNTGTTITTSANGGVSNGNIYNISPVGTTANPATITIAGSATSIYKGDIGDTNLNVHPFDNEMPYINSTSTGWAIQANKNISLQLNGPGVVALAPVPNQSNGEEYTGTTNVTGGTLVLGRTATYSGTVGSATLGSSYTINGGGDVTIGSGSVLASLTTAAGTYVGGASGTITLAGGSQLIPGEANGTTLALSTDNVGALSVNNLNFDDNASMTFSIASLTSYDYLFYNGSFNLDSPSADHTINVALAAGKTLQPGTYTLINGYNGIGGDNTNGDGTSTGFVIGTTPTGYSDFTFKLFDNAGETETALLLQITAPVLQWDPNGTGLATPTNTITEGSGEWTDGTGSDGNPASMFYDYVHSQDIPWTNSANQRVYIGNDASQNGGTITLGSNISLTGNLTFGAIAAGANYDIVNTGTSYTLTLGGGITVSNSAATSTGGPLGLGTPSAEIDAPIVLSADQNWDVPSSQFLDIKGNVTGSFALTQIDTGTIDIESTGGAIGSLNLNAGVMLIAGSGSIGATTPINFNGGALEVTANATLTNPLTFGTSGGSIGAAQSSTAGAPTVTLTLPAISTANPVKIFGTGTVDLAASNTFNGGLTIAGGTVPVTAVAQLGASTSLTLTGGTLALAGIPTLTNNLNTGTSATGNGSLSDTVPLTMNLNGTGIGALTLSGTQFTIDAANGVSTGAILGGSTGVNIHIAAAGTLTVGGFTGTATSAAGSTLYLDSGTVVMTSNTDFGGGTAGCNVVLAAGTTLTADWNNNGGRIGGAITFNGGTTTATEATLNRLYVSSGVNVETSFQANSAADAWTINGHTLIDDPVTLTQNIDEIVGITNPVVVSTGAVLTLECDNTFGFGGNDAVDFRGPTSPSTDYDDFVIHAGATVTQAGPGELRFGRVNTQGIAIIGQGTPGSESVVQLGLDCYMTDNVTTANLTAGQINTTLLANGSGNAGLRIEAPMNAVYVDPSTAPPTSEAIGTTGLFGVNTYSTNSAGSPFTVYSTHRAEAISSTYNDGTNTFTPSGTLTLAANDAGNVTGLINAGPLAACAVTLALDNTSGSGGTHIYQIDPASPQGGSFANFAGLTVEQSNSGGAHVVAQLKGNTKVPALSITGAADVDITNQALVVDPATGPAPTSLVVQYLANAYDHGNWDGSGGIGSSWFTNGMALPGTSIGYAENDALPVPYDKVSNFFGGSSGQPVDGNAVLVRYTWLGDLNLDGVVNSADLAMMDNIPTSGPEAGVIGWFDGDLNYDGKINGDDWSLFLLGDSSQTTQLAAAVPEPMVASMLAIGLMGLVSRRRRV